MNFNNFDCCVVIEFDAKCSSELKDLINLKLGNTRERKGVELKTQFFKNYNNEEIFLLVSADTNRFLQGAEEICLKKVHKDGAVRDFLLADMNNFADSDNTDNFLSNSERLKILEYELNNLKADAYEANLDGKLKITQHDGLINQLKKKGLIQNVFPLHNKEELKKLEHGWYKSINTYSFFSLIPIEGIRAYFGESIAFYFRFFEFYTKALYSYALVGLVTWLLPVSPFYKFIALAVFNLIWNTVFIEVWKRKSTELCFKWGMFDLDLTDRPRPQFYGEPSFNPVTNKPELSYSKRKRTLQKYLVSYPLIAFSIFVAFLFMMGYYYAQNEANEAYKGTSYIDQTMQMLPSIVYSFVVIPLNLVYKVAAIKLTNWENHRTESSYESNLTTKLFVFYFANNFMTLFYEAFFNRDYNNISNLLISMVIVNALVNKLTEVFAPYLVKKFKKKLFERKVADEIEKQAFALDPYEGTYSDYVTVFEQYGYLILFSAVFPWVAAAALVNNIMEQRSDAFKYCHVNQRPFPAHAAHGIGPWLVAFELLGLISVATNMALIALHPDVRSHFAHLTDAEYYLCLVVIEHVLIIAKVSIMYIIPDESARITQAKQRYRFESMEALKSQRLSSWKKTQ